MIRQPAHPLWDLPTRVFHWGIVCCIPLAWWSAEYDNFDVHQWTGYTVIVLVVARIGWGFWGSPHSRFSDFLVGPRRLINYFRGSGDYSAGHNPAGGWSVLAMLSMLLAQAISGLFNSDDVLFSGPLHYGAETGLRDSMGVVHDIAFNVLLGVIVLHLLAVCYHQFRLHEKLVQAMVRGSAAGREGTAAPVSPWRALVILLLAAAALWWGLELAPRPQALAW